MNLENRVNRIFDFLKEHRLYNCRLQKKYLHKILSPYNNKGDKFCALLYDRIMTQSNPKIDEISNFFKEIYSKKALLKSYNGFCEILGGRNYNYIGLFHAVDKMPGWGYKTSALLTKTIYQIHHLPQYNKFAIWDDTPDLDIRNDIIKLPVDIVILNVFSKLQPSIKWNFQNINSFLSEIFNPRQLEIWDDLWFWGFVTQQGSGYNREHKWNPNKYWSLSDSDKSRKNIEQIERKSKIFLKLIN